MVTVSVEVDPEPQSELTSLVGPAINVGKV